MTSEEREKEIQRRVSGKTVEEAWDLVRDLDFFLDEFDSRLYKFGTYVGIVIHEKDSERDGKHRKETMRIVLKECKKLHKDLLDVFYHREDNQMYHQSYETILRLFSIAYTNRRRNLSQFYQTMLYLSGTWTALKFYDDTKIRMTDKIMEETKIQLAFCVSRELVEKRIDKKMRNVGKKPDYSWWGEL